jgi:chromosome condensin MukBEF MukE localization factor
MTLSEEARERLADLVELQPTKNSELQERWGLESGSEVHQYLENELKDYYFRDDNSLIRATKEAADLVDVEPGVVGDEETGVPEAIRVPALQQQVFSVVAGPDEESESVVSVLQKLREEYDVDPDAEEVRSALQALRRKGVVEVVYRTVPTFKLAVERDEVEVSISN